jgi:2-polyprenyl-6-methoxyphenol hydroxylase-like FAD-dependent oxidoreductase
LPAKPRILIAGAGTTGLTAALELTRRGLAPRIVDRDPGPTSLSKAVGVSPRSLDLLEPSGVTERLLAQGLRMRRVQARFEGKLLATVSLDRLPHRFNFLLSLPQHDTETIMQDVLVSQGGHVDWNTELTGLRLAGDAVEVELAGPGGPETAQFDYVFGADGPHSRVRETAGIAFEGYVHERLWSIADAMIPDWPYPPDQAAATLHRNGDVGFIIPIGPGRFRTVSNTPKTLDQIPGAASATVLQADTFHLPVKQARTYQQGRLFLGGDAAHVHSPIGARGMNLGIEDATAFARRFAEDALDGYTAERHPVARSWVVLSERMLAGAQASNPLVVPLRNLAIRGVGKLPALQQPMMRRISGLTE